MVSESFSPSARLPERLEAPRSQLEEPQAAEAKPGRPVSALPRPAAQLPSAAAAASLLVPTRLPSSVLGPENAASQEVADALDSLLEEAPAAADAAPTATEQPPTVPSSTTAAAAAAAAIGPPGRGAGSGVIDLCSEDELTGGRTDDRGNCAALAGAAAPHAAIRCSGGSFIDLCSSDEEQQQQQQQQQQQVTQRQQRIPCRGAGSERRPPSASASPWLALAVKRQPVHALPIAAEQQETQRQRPEHEAEQQVQPQAVRQQPAISLFDNSDSGDGGSVSHCSEGTDPACSSPGSLDEEREEEDSQAEGQQMQQAAGSGSLLTSSAPPSSRGHAMEWEASLTAAAAAPGVAASAAGMPAAASQGAAREAGSSAAAVGQVSLQPGPQEKEGGQQQQPQQRQQQPQQQQRRWQQQQRRRSQQGCITRPTCPQAHEDSELLALGAVRATVHALVDACVASAAASWHSNGVVQQQGEVQPLRSQPQPRPTAFASKLSGMSPAQQRLAQSVQQVRWWQAAVLERSPLHAGVPPAVAPCAAASAASTHSAAPAAAATGGHAALLPAAAGGAAPGAGDGPAGGPASAAAAAGAAGLAGGGGAAAPAGPAEVAEEDPMPDPSDTVAMLHWLRARIPRHLLEEYRQPFQISEEEKAVTEERLAEFEAEIRRAVKSRRVQAKFDLNAASQMPTLHPEWGLWDLAYGHKPGTYPGQKFAGRGALQALGVHTNYYGGIQSRKEDPAFAICLSGGYEDDDDHGDWLWYTGKGGRDSNGVQVQSQSFTGANAAIRACMEQGKPLRVCRGFHVETTQVDPKTGREKVVKQLQYTYDGLYAVIKAELCDSENSTRKPIKVCRYLMVGIPGHYKSNRSISFVELRGFRNMRLAAARPAASEEESEEEGGEEEEEVLVDDWQRYPKRRRTSVHQAAVAAASSAAAAAAAAAAPKHKKKRQAGWRAHAAPAAPAPTPGVVQDAAWLAAQRARPGFIAEDISRGVESRKIPAFNEVDGASLDDLQYVKHSTFGSDAARKLAHAARALMPPSWCGLKQNRRRATWTPHGVMDTTSYFGLWECCCDKGVCRGGDSCRSNRVITDRSIHQPLELFRTRWKGWGVRCAADLEPGAFVATYEGELITTAEAEERRGGDAYLFDLEHFVLMHQDPSIRQKDRLPPLPACCRQDEDHLVVDALRIGNVARYINHSCAPNLLVQPVLRGPGDSGLKYGVALVALRPIRAGEELTYDYKYQVGSVPDKEIRCYCGAKKCRGRLL